MTCSHCHSDKAWHVVSRFNSETGNFEECCDSCGLQGSGTGVPDVYLRRSGQTFDNLCDKMGRPIPIQSKRHKKEVMDSLGVREAGERVNGARFGTKSWIDGSREARKREFAKDRPEIQRTFKRWKETGYARS